MRYIESDCSKCGWQLNLQILSEHDTPELVKRAKADVRTAFDEHAKACAGAVLKLSERTDVLPASGTHGIAPAVKVSL